PQISKREEVPGVPAPKLRLLARVLQPLGRELADRLEHPEPLALAHADEALVDERLQPVEIGVANRLGSLERAAASKDRQSREQTLLVRLEQVVLPLDRPPQR